MTVAGRGQTAQRCVIVAAAGYGKTAEARAQIADIGDDPRTLLLDDLPQLTAVKQRALAERVLSQPDDAPALLVSRWPLPVLASLLAVRGQVRQIGATDLALDLDETARVLRRQYRLHDPELVAGVHELTTGWPVLVHLCGEHLAGASGSLARLPARLTAGRSAVADYLEREVLEPLPPAARRLLHDIAELGPVDATLLRQMGYSRPGAALTLLAGTGLLAPVRAADGTGVTSLLRVVPLLGHVLRAREPAPQPRRRDRLDIVAARYLTDGLPGEAIRLYAQASRFTEAAQLLARYGPRWVTAGGARAIADLIRLLPIPSRTDEVQLLFGEALLVLGEDDDAIAVLGALAAQRPAGVLDAAVAWRLGAVHYLRAEPAAAAAAMASSTVDEKEEASTVDGAMLLAWRASVCFMTGDVDGVARLGRAAERMAEVADSERARASAHVALGLHAMLVGDRAGNAAHNEAALRHAEAAGDLVQAARVQANRASQLLEEARYADAMHTARAAGALASTAGFAAILAMALCNEAEALTRLGRLDEAAACCDQALAIFQRKRSRKVAYPLVGLATIHRLRGRYGLARAAFDEAVRTTTSGGDMQGRVRALAGLGRVTGDAVQAAQYAAEATEAATGPFRTEALLSSGWVALSAGRRCDAARAAADAGREAARHRDTAGMAESLELEAACATDTGVTRRALREAAETWRSCGALLDADRVTAALSDLPDLDAAERMDARLARDRLLRHGLAGVRPLAPGSADHPNGAVRLVPSVELRVLGRFRVIVDGAPVPHTAWQSRKARDLLRMLVARRGRPAAREELAEWLWPGDDPDRLGHRLSVALSTLRAVLDPERRTGADHFVIAGRSGLALDLDHVEVDVELFADEAAHGLRLRDQGHPEPARHALAAAERRYAGDVFEDDPYEDWSVPVREEARATYLRTARALAELSTDVDERVSYLLKVLDRDPYDERCHRDLVDALADAGRHGEARRAGDRYAAAMRALGIPA